MTNPLEAITLEAWQRFFDRARWYGAKERRLLSVRVVEADSEGEACWVLVDLSFSDGRQERYQLLGPQVDAQGDLAENPVASGFVDWLLAGVKDATRSLPGGSIRLRSFGAGADELAAGLVDAALVPLGGEMSNSLFRLGGGFLVKIYRRVEAGVHPEVEALERLREKGFVHAPRLLACGEYLASGKRDGAALFLIQEYIDGARSLWELFTGGGHDLEVLARRAGELTASLHVALEDGGEVDAGEAPPANVAEVFSQLETHAADAATDDVSRDLVSRVVARRAEILRALERSVSPDNRPIRIHGDYHLGQLLLVEAEDRLVILDLEGEPALDLASRRALRPAAQDVASFLRSFSYARHVKGEDLAWESALRRNFLDSYLAASHDADFVPRDLADFRRAVAVCELRKALAELRYELGHRPDWISIPLAALVEILER